MTWSWISRSNNSMTTDGRDKGQKPGPVVGRIHGSKVVLDATHC